MLALLHREMHGEGSTVTTSLMESALASLVNQASNFLMNGNVPQLMGSQHPNIAPYGDVYESSDGFPVLLAIGTERQFKHLCECLELQHLLQQAEFQTNTLRVQHREALNKVIQAAISKQSLADLMTAFRTHGVPAARIRDMRQVFEIPTAQEMILDETLADGTLTKRMKTVVFSID